jgi:hypothetical protein
VATGVTNGMIRMADLIKTPRKKVRTPFKYLMKSPVLQNDQHRTFRLYITILQQSAFCVSLGLGFSTDSVLIPYRKRGVKFKVQGLSCSSYRHAVRTLETSNIQP